MGKVKARRERLLKHIRAVHPEIITLLRSQKQDPDNVTLTGLSALHDRIPHVQQDSFALEGGIGNASN